MMGKVALQMTVIAFVCGCSATQGPEDALPANKWANIALADVTLSAEEEATVRALVEQLVLAEGEASNRPTLNPGMKIYGADGNEVKPAGDLKKAEEYRRRYEACELAFHRLGEFGIAAFPILVEHLADKRQSINFRNHYMANSVGDACFWNVYFQLLPTPNNYSTYGEGRTGRDGENHVKPRWDGTPFDDAGGMKEWLEQNKALTYREMQIKCLQWFLEREKAIGACDAESYFVNILPLEIRIAECRQACGQDVNRELCELRRVMSQRDSSAIPAALLPAR